MNNPACHLPFGPPIWRVHALPLHHQLLSKQITNGPVSVFRPCSGWKLPVLQSFKKRDTANVSSNLMELDSAILTGLDIMLSNLRYVDWFAPLMRSSDNLDLMVFERAKFTGGLEVCGEMLQSEWSVGRPNIVGSIPHTTWKHLWYLSEKCIYNILKDALLCYLWDHEITATEMFNRVTSLVNA